MTSPDDRLTEGRETFENLVRRVAAHPIAEAQEAIAKQLFPLDKRLREVRDTIEDLGEDVGKHHQGDSSFHASAYKEFAALRAGQDELRGAVQQLSAELAGTEEGLAQGLRYLAVLYVLLTVALGLVIVLLVLET